MFFKKRLVIGLIEKVRVEGGKTYNAKVDTGADSSSIDTSIVEKLGLEYLGHKTVRSALGRHRRPTVMVSIEFEGKTFNERFTVADRSNLKYKVLIGKDILKKERFLVDPCKE